MRAGEIPEFIEVCGVLKREVLESMRNERQMPQEAVDWVEQVDFRSFKAAQECQLLTEGVAQVIDYNCVGGKLNRGLSVVHWWLELCLDLLHVKKTLTVDL